MGVHRLIRGGRSWRPPRHEIHNSRHRHVSSRALIIGGLALAAAVFGLFSAALLYEANRSAQSSASIEQRAARISEQTAIIEQNTARIEERTARLDTRPAAPKSKHSHVVTAPSTIGAAAQGPNRGSQKAPHTTRASPQLDQRRRWWRSKMDDGERGTTFGFTHPMAGSLCK
jgi:hypothetical protein